MDYTKVCCLHFWNTVTIVNYGTGVFMLGGSNLSGCVGFEGCLSKLLLTCIVDEAVNHGYVGVIALVCQLSLSSISPHFHIGVEDCGLVSCTAEIIGGDGD
jgi:hypothetical protein